MSSCETACSPSGCESCGKEKALREIDGWNLCYECWTNHLNRSRNQYQHLFDYLREPVRSPPIWVTDRSPALQPYQLTWTTPHTVTSGMKGNN